MSVIDKIIATVTPDKTPEERAEAHVRAKQMAPDGSWFSAVLHHHEMIEAAFDNVKLAADASARRFAERQLGGLLTGHSLAEEAVLYPNMALGTQKMHATEAYTEQSAAKVNMAALEMLDPMSQDYIDKLEHVRHAVLMHVYQEESTWFPELLNSGDPQLQGRLTMRYAEEFDRYMKGTPTSVVGTASTMMSARAEGDVRIGS